MQRQWLIGFYSGLGDIVCAHRWICLLGIQHDDVRIDVVVSGAARSMANVLLWPPNVCFVPFAFPRHGQLAKFASFLSYIFSQHYERIFNSPHPQISRASWKLPLLFGLMRVLRRAKVSEGAADDHLSWIYSRRYAVDRAIPLGNRDGEFFQMAGILENQNLNVINSYIIKRQVSTSFQIGFHVGASLSTRRWPAESVLKFIRLFRERNPSFELVIFGLSDELKEFREAFDWDGVTAFEGDLKQVVDRILCLRALITMDSGFMHMAAVAELPQVALFGASEVGPHRPLNEHAIVLFEQRYSCQPCGAKECYFEKNVCMEAITPLQVVEAIEELLGQAT